jgi:hypothetical protein
VDDKELCSIQMADSHKDHRRGHGAVKTDSFMLVMFQV